MDKPIKQSYSIHIYGAHVQLLWLNYSYNYGDTSTHIKQRHLQITSSELFHVDCYVCRPSCSRKRNNKPIMTPPNKPDGCLLCVRMILAIAPIKKLGKWLTYLMLTFCPLCGLLCMHRRPPRTATRSNPCCMLLLYAVAVVSCSVKYLGQRIWHILVRSVDGDS